MMRDDVPLIDAQLCWNDGNMGEAPTVVSLAHHLSRKESERVAMYDNTIGSCFSHWRGLSDNGRLVELMRDAFFAVAKDGVDINLMTAALMRIPEFRAIMHPGELRHWIERLDLDIAEEEAA